MALDEITTQIIDTPEGDSSDTQPRHESFLHISNETLISLGLDPDQVTILGPALRGEIQASPSQSLALQPLIMAIQGAQVSGRTSLAA